MSGTMAEEVWRNHIVSEEEGGTLDLLCIDLHLVYEATNPQAFESLRLTGRQMRRPDLTIATEDHNMPVINIDQPIADITNCTQIDTLRKNAEEFGTRPHSLDDANQGIVYMVGLQLDLTQPGMTIMYGDSHTSICDVFDALAFGISISQVEHVLTTQTLPMVLFKTMVITANGSLPEGSMTKDIILAVITKIGTGGDQGHVLEHHGQAIYELSMEGRTMICNTSIEVGARAGMIAPDQTTFDCIRGRSHASEGEDWDRAAEYRSSLVSDEDTVFGVEVTLEAVDIEPFVIWGTNPGQGVPLFATVPAPEDFTDEAVCATAERALEYMDLKVGTPMRDITVDAVFTGSCTSDRIEDLRAAANILRGHCRAEGVRVMIVPGFVRVRLQAETESLDKIFTELGTEWHDVGCPMCLGMNPDTMNVGDRSASTSNRNLEGRQGKDSRTHLVPPLVAAITAVYGALSSSADL